MLTITGINLSIIGRLLDENLIEETKNGRYQLTKEGEETAKDVDKMNDIIKNQLEVLFRLAVDVGTICCIILLSKAKRNQRHQILKLQT